MICPNIKNYNRSMNNRGIFASVAILGGALVATTAVPAAAQSRSSAMSQSHTTGNSGRSNVQNGSYAITTSVQPIMTRIATMWEAANQRANNNSLPAGSRTSYRAAASSLRQALAAGHLRPSGTAGGTSNLPVSSFQLTDDIQTLRSAASATGGARSASLNQVATYYATGAKEFFTGTIREALLGTSQSMRGMAMSDGTTGTASSSLMPSRGGLNAYHAEGHRPVGGILQPDGTLSSNPPDVFVAPTQLPAVGDEGYGAALPILEDPYPFNTGGFEPEVIYPAGTNVYPAGTTFPATNNGPIVPPVTPTNIPALPNHVP